VAQVIAAIASVELPHAQWPELIIRLLENMTTSDNAMLKRATLKTIGFVCESIVSIMIYAHICVSYSLFFRIQVF
jgi:hypothetical protein